MSGGQESTSCPSPNPPPAPLRLHSLLLIASSAGGGRESWPPHAPPAGPRKPRILLIFPVVISRLREGLSVRALLRCDFPLRFEASGCSCARLPAGLRLGAGPFASRHSQSHFLMCQTNSYSLTQFFRR